MVRHLAFALTLAVLTACSSTDVGKSTGGLGGDGAGPNGGAPAVNGDVDTSALDGDPSQNQLLLTSKDSDLYAVDPATGKAGGFFHFDDYVKPTSLDVASDTLYVGSNDNSVNAISGKTKGLLWDFPFGKYDGSSLGAPIVTTDGGIGYAAGLTGVLTAFDLTKGTKRWEYVVNPSGETDGIYPHVGRALVTTDRVFAGTTDSLFDNTLHAVEKATGKRAWKKDLPHPMSGAMKMAGGTLLVPAGDLFALDAKTGTVLWQLPQERLSRGASTPSVAGDAVLVEGAQGVGTPAGRLYCLDLATGAVRWQLEAGNDYAGVWEPLVVGSLVFGVYERGSSETPAGNGRPFLADIATGAVVWANDRVSVESDPVFANGRLFFHGQDFDRKGGIDDAVGLMSLDAKTGQLLWLQTTFRYAHALTPVVVATTGVFRAAYATP